MISPINNPFKISFNGQKNVINIATNQFLTFLLEINQIAMREKLVMKMEDNLQRV